MERNEVKISIIVSVYNTEEYLRECIESILRQTFSNIELILINDGSTDSSLNIIEEYAKLDNRIVVINQKNHGQGYSRNRGVEKSVGEYILFLDSDDYFEPDTVENLYKKSEAYDTELLYFSGKVVNDIQDERYYTYNPYKRNWGNETSVILGKEYFLEKYPNVIASSCMVLIRRDFLENHKIVFREKYFHEDVAYNFRLLMNSYRVSICDYEFYCRRFRPESVTTMRFTIKHVLGLVHASLDIIDEIKESESEIDFYYRYAYQFWAQAINEFFDVVSCDEERIEFVDCAVIFLDKVSDDLHRIQDIEIIRQIVTTASKLVKHGLIIGDVIRLHISLVDDYDRKQFLNLGLNDSSKSIAIYGIGKTSSLLLEKYEKSLGEVKSKLMFIVTNNNKPSTFMNRDVICVDDLEKKNVDVIIITSRKYRDQMISEIENRYGKKYQITEFYI